MFHDLQTPLTGIIGFAKLIQKEAVGTKMKQYANHLVLATTTLLDFQNELLDEITAHKKRDSIEKNTFHLKTVVKKVIHLTKPKAIFKKLTLRFSIDNALPEYVQGNSKYLFRILLELVTNALKFTKKGYITIHCSAEKITSHRLMLRCAVSDTGIGIPKEKQNDIFIRHHRLSLSDNIEKGSGLGLALVKQYIKDLHGKITVKSMPGAGSTFIFFIPFIIVNKLGATFPVSDRGRDSINNSKRTQHESKAKKNAPFKRILLIEDNVLTAHITKLMLLELHCTVDIAKTGKAALLKVKKISYDFILMDLELPDCKGFTLAKKLRNQSAPIIALTAHSKEDIAHHHSCDIKAIFQKPLSLSTAIKILNQRAVAKLPL